MKFDYTHQNSCAYTGKLYFCLFKLGVWGHGPKSYNWVLGFGQEHGALAKSVRSSSPRRNISSDKLNADWI